MLWITIIVVTVVLSFRAYSTQLTPQYNSDHAIHVLMAYDLKLPEDLYYWGQNRLGSIVPILGHLVLKFFPVSPIQAVSYTQYFLLLVGYLCFSSLLKSLFLKLVLAIAWFLPLTQLTELLRTGQPYAGQFAFIGIAIALLNQLFQNPQRFLGVRKQMIISICTIMLWLGVWVSDFTVVLIVVLVGFLIRYIYIHNAHSLYGIALLKKIFLSLSTITILITSLVGVLFIACAKSSALRSRNSFKINTFSQIVDVLFKLADSLLRTLTFQNSSTFNSIFALIAVATVCYLAQKRDTFRTLSENHWGAIFLVSAILSTGLLIASNWFYNNEMSLRYFVPVYIYGWMALLLWVDVPQTSSVYVARSLLVCAAIASSLTLPAHVFSPQRPVAQAQQLEPLKMLSSAGIIGEYWQSYVLCSVNPEQLSCTIPDARKGEFSCPEGSLSPELQREKAGRCPRCTRRVFESQTIYLVKEGWLDALPKPIDFPTKTQQFGQCLVKMGDPLQVAGYTLAPYKRQAVMPSQHTQTAKQSLEFLEKLS